MTADDIRESQAKYKEKLEKCTEKLNFYKNADGKVEDQTALRDLYILRESFERIDEKYTQLARSLSSQVNAEAEKLQIETDRKEVSAQCISADDTLVDLIAHVKANISLNKTEEYTVNTTPDFSALINALTDNIKEQQKQREADSAKMKEFLKNQEEQFKAMLLPSTSAHVEDVERIKIPQFYGNYLEWKSFHDVYVSVVHSNPRFSNIQKMNYLKTGLKGDAALVISHLSICEENYEAAWSAILRHYNDKRSMVAAHIDTFMQQSVVSQASASAIKRLQTTSSCVIQTLDSLSVSQKDPWIITHLLSKLDPETKSQWAREKFDDIPTWRHFEEFLINRWRELEQYALINPNLVGNQGKKVNNCAQILESDSNEVSSHNASKLEIIPLCPFCQKFSHKLYKCNSFLALPISKRTEAVRSLRFCPNCLADKHSIESCSYQSCNLCNQKHNRLLHDTTIHSGFVTNHPAVPLISNLTPPLANTSYQLNPNEIFPSTPSSFNCVDNLGKVSSRVLLATAMVKIYDIYNQPHVCRVLLDAGSQVNFVTTGLSQDLGLRHSTANLTIEGVGSSTQFSRYMTTVRISPLHGNSNEVYSIDCAVLSRVTSDQPNWNINLCEIPIPRSYKLADPQWHVTSQIDILIGAALFFEIVGGQIIRLGNGLPMLRDSTLGWLVVGAVNQTPNLKSSSHPTIVCNSATFEHSHTTIQKTWDIKSLPTDTLIKNEHGKIEEIFSSTATRFNDERYIAHLPLNETITDLESNHQLALRQFNPLESCLCNDCPDLRGTNAQIFEDCLSKGTANLVPRGEFTVSFLIFSHNWVARQNTLLVKVYNNIFDTHAKSEKGVSLYDCLEVGSVIYPVLCSEFLKIPRLLFTVFSDNPMMLLQFLLLTNYKDCLRIKWHSISNEYHSLIVFIDAVAYPPLMTRVLSQLAANEDDILLAATAFSSNLCVDGFMCSISTIHELKEIMKQFTVISNCVDEKLFKIKLTGKSQSENTVSSADFHKNLVFNLLSKSDIPLFKLNLSNIPLESSIESTRSVSQYLQVNSCVLSIIKMVINGQICNPKNNREVFAKSKVATIPSNTRRHVLLQENPTDVFSRGVTPDKLLTAEPWWKGFPNKTLSFPNDCDAVAKSTLCFVTSIIPQNFTNTTNPNLDSLYEHIITKYNSSNKNNFVLVTVVLKAISRLKVEHLIALISRDSPPWPSGGLFIFELQFAENS